ncbi:MAG: site-specific integrase [Rhodospirillaceae bacterium]
MARESYTFTEKNLTAAKTRFACPPGKKDAIFFDASVPGLGLRCYVSGARKWVLQYKSPADFKDKKKVIGDYPAWTVSAAQERARELRVQIDRGECPVTAAALAEEARKAAINAQASLVTVAKAIELYDVGCARLKLRDSKRTVAKLKAALQPFADCPVRDLNRGDIVRRLDEIAATSGPVASNRAKSYIRAAFTWWLDRNHVDAIPIAGLRHQHQEKAKDRVLTDLELVAVWKTATPEIVGPAFADIVRLLVLTGCRRQELGSLEWRDVDLDGKTITIRAELSKSRATRVVPLSAPAAAILANRPRHAGPFVFGDGTGGEKALSGWGKPKDKLDKASGVTKWTLHDLRRTAATRMDELGVSIATIEAILGHLTGARGGIVGVYNRGDYRARATEALELWGRRLLEISAAKAESTNVVKLDGTRAKSAAA